MMSLWYHPNNGVVVATLTKRNIPQGIYKRLQSRAEKRGRSLNAEVLNILADEDSWDVRRRQIASVLPGLRQLRAENAKAYPKGSRQRGSDTRGS